MELYYQFCTVFEKALVFQAWFGYPDQACLERSHPVAKGDNLDDNGPGLEVPFMYNHEPENYECPFCNIIQKGKEGNSNADSEIICQTEIVTTFIGLGRWPKNPFDLLIVPNQHIENIYDLPGIFAGPLHIVSRGVALALKRIYACDGISLRQHNEPAGNQDVWHFHIHLTPRYTGDNFYGTARIAFPPAERLAEAQRIRGYVQTNQDELFGG